MLAPPEASSSTWPLEGCFGCGTGLLVSQQCLGRSFQTRTATYELTITLPELDSATALAPLRRPPWRFNDRGEVPAAVVDEEWGELGGLQSRNSDQEAWSEYPALVRKCIVASTVEVENDEQFRAAAGAFAVELNVWWSCFTDWLGVLVAQDFLGLGIRRYDLLECGFHAWSGDESGARRAGMGKSVHSVHPYPEVIGQDQLQRAMDLAAGGQRPAAAWLFIRDAQPPL